MSNKRLKRSKKPPKKTTTIILLPTLLLIVGLIVFDIFSMLYDKN